MGRFGKIVIMPLLSKRMSTYLHHCLLYIDLNMVRAGVVDHPAHWVNGGYREIQQPPKRYTLIDLPALLALCGFSKLAEFQQSHRQWVDEALHGALGATPLRATRDERWTEALAVGSQAFVEKVKSELGPKALHRGLDPMDGTYALRESVDAYTGHFAVENEALRPENALLWDRIAEVP